MTSQVLVFTVVNDSYKLAILYKFSNYLILHRSIMKNRVKIVESVNTTTGTTIATAEAGALLPVYGRSLS